MISRYFCLMHCRYSRRNKVYASLKLYKTPISVNCGSDFQVRFVWQVWEGQLSPSFKFVRFQSFWRVEMRPKYDKLHARILRGKGVQKKKPTMFTGSLSEAQQAQLLLI